MALPLFSRRGQPQRDHSGPIAERRGLRARAASFGPDWNACIVAIGKSGGTRSSASPPPPLPMRKRNLFSGTARRFYRLDRGDR